MKYIIFNINFSEMQGKKNNWFAVDKIFLVLASAFLIIVFVGAFFYALGTNINNSRAAFNSSTGRFEDSLIVPHQVAQYTYVYENTTGVSQVGFFELQLQNTVGSFPDDVLRVVNVVDSFPTDSSGTLLPGGQDVNVPIGNSSYFSGNKLIVRVSPQNSCIQRPVGGCQEATLSPGARGKITIQIAFRDNPATGQNTFEGVGAMNYILTNDQSPIGWRITANLQNTNFVLDRGRTPDAEIAGSGGTGQPVIGTNYSIAVTNIKATNGSNLQSPTGKCITNIGGDQYVGVGISNGRCVISIPINTSITVPGGTVTVEDGGSPLPLSISGISYAQKDSVTDVTSFRSDISSVLQSGSGAGFIVFFDTTGFTNGDDGIYSRFYFDTEDTGVTDKNHFGGSPYVIPISARPEGAQQICVIVAKPDNSIIEDSGNCANLDPQAEIDPEEGKIGITNEEIEGLDFLCEIAIQSSLTDCNIVFPSDKTLPEGGLRIAVGNVGLGGQCSKTGDLVSCERVPVGDILGANLVYAGVGDVEPILTGETAVILEEGGQNIDEVLANDANLTQEQIDELNRLAGEFGVNSGRTTGDSSPGVDTSTDSDIDGDLSRTGGGALAVFGLVGFASVAIMYAVTVRSEHLRRKSKINTPK